MLKKVFMVLAVSAILFSVALFSVSCQTSSSSFFSSACKGCNGKGVIKCYYTDSKFECVDGYLFSDFAKEGVDEAGFLLDSETGERVICPYCKGSAVLDCPLCN